jgi:hypothetical protein
MPFPTERPANGERQATKDRQGIPLDLIFAIVAAFMFWALFQGI